MSEYRFTEAAPSFTLEGVTVCVYAATALPNGGLATGHYDPETFDFTEDTAIRVWDQDGVLQATLEGHTGSVVALTCSASGDIVSGSWAGEVKVWRDNTCALNCVGHEDRVRAVAVSPVDDIIASGSDDGRGKVWSTMTGECLANLDHMAFVAAVCVLGNGDVLTGADNTVRVWGRGSWECIMAHDLRYEVGALASLPGSAFVVGGGDYSGPGAVSLWRGSAEESRTETDATVQHLAVAAGVIAARSGSGVSIVRDGSLQSYMAATEAAIAWLTPGELVIVEGKTKKTFWVGRPSRIMTVDTMAKAWLVHAGTPPSPTDTASPEAVLARTLSLRRFCRTRGAEGSVEVVEPFARDIVGFM